MTSPRERFNALPKATREKVLEDYHNWNVDDDWWDDTLTLFISDMAEKGIETSSSNCGFSGFSSQGDGAHFQAHNISWAKYLAGEFKDEFKCFVPAIEYLSISSRHRGSYSNHESIVEHTVELDWPNEFDEQSLRWHAREHQIGACDMALMEFDRAVNKNLRGHMKDLYRRLEDEYNYQTSDEAILDSLEINEKLEEILKELEETNETS